MQSHLLTFRPILNAVEDTISDTQLETTPPGGTPYAGVMIANLPWPNHCEGRSTLAITSNRVHAWPTFSIVHASGLVSILLSKGQGNAEHCFIKERSFRDR